MSVPTWLFLRVCAGLGTFLLLVGGGVIFLCWKDSWISRLTGLVIALTGLILSVVFTRELFQYQQSIDYLQTAQLMERRFDFSKSLLMVGGFGAIGGTKFFKKRKVLRILCGAVAVLGLILSIYYAVLEIQMYL